MALEAAKPNCIVESEGQCEPQYPAHLSPLCGHTPEQFADVAILLEPSGPAWGKDRTTKKAALYRAFGKLLSEIEGRVCDLMREALGCESVELIGEWEAEYGLPASNCLLDVPASLQSRQAMVCAIRSGDPMQTLADLESVLRSATGCQTISLSTVYRHSVMGGQAGSPLMIAGGICIDGLGACGIVQSSTNGAWEQLNCLLEKHLPAHIAFEVCS